MKNSLQKITPAGWLVSALLLAAAGGPAAEPRTLITTYTEFPPFAYTDKSGKPAGIYIDVYNATARLAGYNTQFKAYPSARSYRFLESGDIDVWLGVADVPAIKDQVLEVPAPPFVITLKLWFMEDTPPIKSLDDIESGNLVAIEGYTYGDLIGGTRDKDFPFHIIRSTEHKHALRILESGRADYMIGYERPVTEALATVNVEGLESHTVNRQFAAFVISKRTRAAPRIHRELAEAYRKIREATR